MEAKYADKNRISKKIIWLKNIKENQEYHGNTAKYIKKPELMIQNYCNELQPLYEKILEIDSTCKLFIFILIYFNYICEF